MERILSHGFPIKIAAACITGASAPLAARLIGYDDVGAAALATMLGAGLTLIALARILSPLAKATAAVEAFVADGSIIALPKTGPDTLGRLIWAIAVIRTHSQEKVGMLTRIANLDPLTNLPNRRAFDALREQAAAGPCAVAVVDVDHFKRVNDAMGHAAGDEVLRAVAEYLRDGIRPSDFLARIGGEEFALVFPGATTGQAEAMIDRIRSRLWEEAPYRIGEEPVTFSAGVCSSDNSAGSIRDALRRADRALYRAKAAGRNRIETEAE